MHGLRKMPVWGSCNARPICLRTRATAKCPCTNANRILGKYVSSIHRSILKNCRPVFFSAVTDLKLIICFQLKPIIKQTQTYRVFSLNLKVICRIFSNLEIQRWKVKCRAFYRSTCKVQLHCRDPINDQLGCVPICY